MNRRIAGFILLALGVLALPAAALAAEFNVERATRAYLDILQGPARAKSDAYFEGGYWLTLWGAVVSVLVDGLLLRFRLSARFRDLAERVFKRQPLQVWLTALLYMFWGFVVTMPWSVYTSFFREKQYGLMNQDLGGWFGDLAKLNAVNFVLMPVLIVAIYAVIRRFAKNWWLLGSGIFAAFLSFFVLIAPVYFAPMINTYTEMAPGPIRERIVAMAAQNNVPAQHIYVFDASKQTKRISANVSGLGPTIRISLNDNLLDRTSRPEIAAVMGHELGHYVLGHNWRLLIVMSGLSALLLFAVSRIGPKLIARHGARWGIRDMADPASLPVFGIILAVLGLLVTPAANMLIRVNESEADAFGLDTAKEPDAFAQVAMKLSEYRKIEPGPVEEMLFFDHPSGATRVRMAMQWKKDHVPGAQMVTPPPMTAEQPATK